MKVKKVFKYATGQPIPEGAVYLCTKIQTTILTTERIIKDVWLVWHYFLVEVTDE